ncbi:MAG: DUF1566 domain-containing protein [Treponema sp.]|jgi:hypothetical protein|nr:DUF1566 domain-containing protein [Treponema sp.]
MKKAIMLIGLCAVTAALFAQNTLPRLAVVSFNTNDVTDQIRRDAITVRNIVESQMVATGKYQIVTRDDIDKLLENQRIQVSAISSSENLQKLQLANIKYIVTGALDAMGSDYAITIRVLDVSTGQFSHSANDFMGGGSRELYNGITALMVKFNSGMSAGEGGAIVQGAGSRSGASGNYKVGDFGPAGGHIFYDKGVFSGGWRYLEAAPAETEFTAQWGAYEKDVAGTGTGVGSGKRNTQLIVDRLKGLGESGRAAQLCASMNFDGFDDWFLPSKDELDLMYKNLKQKGLGGFGGGYYWSSSQNNSNSAWYQLFSNGVQNLHYKDDTYSVRAIRAF